MKVDIIIPNYNGSHLIERNISAVLKSIENYNSKIIVVDDGSLNDDKIKLRNILNELNNAKIILVEHKINKGFSSAVNSGVKKSEADFVVLLNSDVVPSRNFLKSPLEKLISDTDIFAIGCMDESIEGSKRVLRGRGLAKWSKGMLIHYKGDINESNTFWASGGSSVFRRELYEKFGGMDEIYNPFYWEDIDLSYRAQKAGYKILFDKNSVVEHYHEHGAIKKNFTSNRVTITAYRNQFIFIWKNISSYHLMINHLIFLPINIVGSIKRNDFNLIKGLFLALGRLPAIIEKRRKQSKFYKVSDIEIIQKIA